LDPQVCDVCDRLGGGQHRCDCVRGCNLFLSLLWSY
jgi:hypothetical protein